jgi:hypothetical protein
MVTCLLNGNLPADDWRTGGLTPTAELQDQHSTARGEKESLLTIDVRGAERLNFGRARYIYEVSAAPDADQLRRLWPVLSGNWFSRPAVCQPSGSGRRASFPAPGITGGSDRGDRRPFLRPAARPGTPDTMLVVRRWHQTLPPLRISSTGLPRLRTGRRRLSTTPPGGCRRVGQAPGSGEAGRANFRFLRGLGAVRRIGGPRGLSAGKTMLTEKPDWLQSASVGNSVKSMES